MEFISGILEADLGRFSCRRPCPKAVQESSKANIGILVLTFYALWTA